MKVTSHHLRRKQKKKEKENASSTTDINPKFQSAKQVYTSRYVCDSHQKSEMRNLTRMHCGTSWEQRGIEKAQFAILKQNHGTSNGK